MCSSSEKYCSCVHIFHNLSIHLGRRSDTVLLCISGAVYVTRWLLGEDELDYSYLLLSWYVVSSSWSLHFCIFLSYVKLCLLICSIGLTIQANMYYKMLIGWTSQKIKDSHAVHNPFDFKHGMVGFFKSY